MCLVALAIDQDRRFPLVVASNRDEFFSRPTAQLDWWTPPSGDPAVLGGRDLESGGTWLGLTAQGRLALLTNVRDGQPKHAAAPSRGRIVTQWLAARESSANFWTRTCLSDYSGFNLIAADFVRGECFWATNALAAPKPLDAGLYGLSNGELDSRWPKVIALKDALAVSMNGALSADDLAIRLFAALGNRDRAEDCVLPKTGISLDRERELSAAFIRTSDGIYGTRCSTLVITERTERQCVTHVFERTFDAMGVAKQLRHCSLRDWPPRYSQGAPAAVVEQAAISESGLNGGETERVAPSPHGTQTHRHS
jgi:uncharacterized protein with NRDE domain